MLVTVYCMWSCQMDVTAYMVMVANMITMCYTGLYTNEGSPFSCSAFAGPSAALSAVYAAIGMFFCAGQICCAHSGVSL